MMSSENLAGSPPLDPSVITSQPAKSPLESQSLLCPPDCDCACHGQVVTGQPTIDDGVGISQTGSRKGCPSCQGPFNSAGVNNSIKNDLITTEIPYNPPDSFWLCCYMDHMYNNGSHGSSDCCACDHCCPGCGDDGCCGGEDCCDCGDCSCCGDLCACCGECCAAMSSCCPDS